MFILRDLLRPLQAHFSDTDLGRERSSLFAYTLLAVIVPFTSSITSNLLRSLVTLFGIEIKKKRFYTFMASSTLPWQKLWQTVWGLIPSPETEGRLLVALDDCINPKIGKNIFGCETIFDHAAKANQSQYPWAQNFVAVGLLKHVKGRWACLFLDFRFYFAKKTIDAEKATAKIKGVVVPFQTKLELAGQMLIGIGHYFPTSPLLAVTDSWFGNQSLWRQVRNVLGDRFNILSRLRCNNVLYAQPDVPQSGQRGRHRKYGKRLGSVTDMAAEVRQKTKIYAVNLYGKHAGSRYFCESFDGLPCPTSGKNYATANAFGGPSRPASLVAYPTRGMQHSYRNDSTRFRKACIFTTQKTLRENTCPIASG